MTSAREKFLFDVISALVGQLGGAALALAARDRARDVLLREGDPTPADFAALEEIADQHLARVRSSLEVKRRVPGE